VARTHLDLPAIVLLVILGLIFVSINVLVTIKFCRQKEISVRARIFFALRNVALFIFLAIALAGFTWPYIRNRKQVDLIAGLI